jgi:hypothetical protein
MDLGLVGIHEDTSSERQMLTGDSNAMRFDLQAPNEYVRGNTLRFVYGPSPAGLYAANNVQDKVAGCRACRTASS